MNAGCHNLPLCSIRGALGWARKGLVATDEPAISARLLLAHILDCTLTDLFVHPEWMLSLDECRAYSALVARRARHEPVAYLVGHRAFMGLDLRVDPRALIPRPETEELVDRALDLARRWPRPRIVDVGTGSGAIAISLARSLPQARIIAIDASPDALALARENAARHGLGDRIALMCGDLLSPLRAQVELIVANLPYVSECEFDALPPDIRLYEPRQALVAGTEGLDAIAALLPVAAGRLCAGGALLLEIGAAQGPAVAALAAHSFPGARVCVLQDLAHRDRVVQVESRDAP